MFLSINIDFHKNPELKEVEFAKSQLQNMMDTTYCAVLACSFASNMFGASNFEHFVQLLQQFHHQWITWLTVVRTC